MAWMAVALLQSPVGSGHDEWGIGPSYSDRSLRDSNSPKVRFAHDLRERLEI
jgi:hypothetical protein